MLIPKSVPVQDFVKLPESYSTLCRLDLACEVLLHCQSVTTDVQFEDTAWTRCLPQLPLYYGMHLGWQSVCMRIHKECASINAGA